jgi:SAM-dependent methyltransferase
MGYVFDFNDAKAYQRWLNEPDNQQVLKLQNRLLLDMLKPLPGKTILDIGCGTGASLIPFIEAGLTGTGIDPSPYMLDIAAGNLDHRVDLHRGFAEDLPFEDNAFHYASMITTLEFVEDSRKAIAEACRVAKHKLFVGVLNRYAIKGVERRIKGIFFRTFYNQARFFSVWELKQIFRDQLGDVPISWKTVCQLPSVTNRFARMVERFSLLQSCPFGMYAGMVVTLAPRFTTKPLALAYGSKQTTGELTG